MRNLKAPSVSSSASAILSRTLGAVTRAGALALALTTSLALIGGGGAAASQSPASQPASWKVLLVAADNQEPVFSNAVDTLRDRLLEYGVASRDIAVLKANAAGPADRATFDNLHDRWDSLLGPASAGCFVYMTAHGARDGGLYFRLNRDVLPPAYLARMLDWACGDRPTVVVTSGCYTGIYAQHPAMRRPNRIVLTAARPDRMSFGCRPDVTYTVFDDCFLRSMRRDEPWAVIALSVSACVADTEVARNLQPASHPQAFVGRAVSHLQAF